MPLQQNPYNPYQYESPLQNKAGKWFKVTVIGLAAIILVSLVILGITSLTNSIKEKSNGITAQVNGNSYSNLSQNPVYECPSNLYDCIKFVNQEQKSPNI